LKLLARRAQHATGLELFDEDRAAYDEAHRARDAHCAERLIREIQEQNSAVQIRHPGASFLKI
jgi:hypothetical protein